jgi:ribonuclease D
MPDAIWIDSGDAVPPLARTLAANASIGLDTEFLRERTFFPQLCLLQMAAGGGVWCIDTLRQGTLEPLLETLTSAAIRKVIHSARQDLEAVYLRLRRVISPVFDTQIAAGCLGLKPQIGYAELVKTLLDVSLSKGQTRTDWSKRPLSPQQLEYAADDVLYLCEIADILTARLRSLNRERWVLEDCAALADASLYEPDPAQAWKRLRGIKQLPPASRARARALAVWREALARERDLPRGWIVSDPAIFALAQVNPTSRAGLAAVRELPDTLNDGFAAGMLQALGESTRAPLTDMEPPQDARPNPEQKAAAERLGRIVDARAKELELMPEILAPRGELKALAMGDREVQSLQGWRRAEIGERLLEALD